VNGEGGLVEVAFELEPGGLDEVLVFRLMRDVRQLAGNIGAAHPLQIDVQITVRAGQQAGRFRRGMLTQHNCQGDGQRDQHNAKPDGESASYAHEI
jgi:hypothetical protein